MPLKLLPVRHRLLALPLILGITAGLLASCMARAGCGDNHGNGLGDAVAATPESRLKLREDSPPKETPEAGTAAEAPSDRRWYAMLCLANAYPGLKSEELITGLFDPIIGAIAPGMERVNTFTDMRDSHLLWVPNIGGGYNISPHFSVFLQLGYGAGPVCTKDSSPSIFFLAPLHLSFEMKRRAFTITPGIDYFPFGMVEQRDYDGLMDRLRAIRPTLGLRVPWTSAGYKAHAKIGVGPIGKLANINLGESWSVWSTNVNVGFDMPISRRNQVNVNFGHCFFYGQNSDFGGNAFSVTWKYLF